MCKKLMALHVLELIEQSLQETLKRSERIADADDFLVSETGVILLDNICMKLSAIGESAKNLDKITEHKLLSGYPEIPWKDVMGIRDFIVHHYFEVDADVIFNICKKDIPVLIPVIQRIIEDLRNG